MYARYTYLYLRRKDDLRDNVVLEHLGYSFHHFVHNSTLLGMTYYQRITLLNAVLKIAFFVDIIIVFSPMNYMKES